MFPFIIFILSIFFIIIGLKNYDQEPSSRLSNTIKIGILFSLLCILLFISAHYYYYVAKSYKEYISIIFTLVLIIISLFFAYSIVEINKPEKTKKITFLSIAALLLLFVVVIIMRDDLSFHEIITELFLAESFDLIIILLAVFTAYLTYVWITIDKKALTIALKQNRDLSKFVNIVKFRYILIFWILLIITPLIQPHAKAILCQLKSLKTSIFEVEFHSQGLAIKNVKYFGEFNIINYYGLKKLLELDKIILSDRIIKSKSERERNKLINIFTSFSYFELFLLKFEPELLQLTHSASGTSNDTTYREFLDSPEEYLFKDDLAITVYAKYQSYTLEPYIDNKKFKQTPYHCIFEAYLLWLSGEKFMAIDKLEKGINLENKKGDTTLVKMYLNIALARSLAMTFEKTCLTEGVDEVINSYLSSIKLFDVILHDNEDKFVSVYKRSSEEVLLTIKNDLLMSLARANKMESLARDYLKDLEEFIVKNPNKRLPCYLDTIGYIYIIFNDKPAEQKLAYKYFEEAELRQRTKIAEIRKWIDDTRKSLIIPC